MGDPSYIFEFYNITPKWINCCENCAKRNPSGLDNETDTLARRRAEGIEDKTTGQWSGAVGMLQRDEADYALPNYALTRCLSQYSLGDNLRWY